MMEAQEGRDIENHNTGTGSLPHDHENQKLKGDGRIAKPGALCHSKAFQDRVHETDVRVEKKGCKKADDRAADDIG